MNLKRTYWLKGMRDGIPIFLGYLAVSFTFGIAAKNAGLTPFQATLMSATNLTSAGQFAALGLITSAAPYMELIITQLVINLRYSLMSASLSQKIDPGTPVWRRLLMSFGVTDEIFGVSSGVRGRLKPQYMFGLIVVALPGWAGGTLLGVLMGSIMPARMISAFSVALYAMFIAVIIPPAKESRVITGIIVLSMAASLVFSLVPVLAQVSDGFRIIILTVAIAGVAAFLFPVKETADEG